MAKALILISHGRFCEGLKESVEMIMGPQDHIHPLALLPEESAEDFKTKFLNLTEKLTDFVVFADLMGGTPCNVVTRLILEGAEIPLYAGMNMPMVIGFINASFTGEDRDFTLDAVSNVQYINQVIAASDDDDDE